MMVKDNKSFGMGMSSHSQKLKVKNDNNVEVKFSASFLCHKCGMVMMCDEDNHISCRDQNCKNKYVEYNFPTISLKLTKE